MTIATYGEGMARLQFDVSDRMSKALRVAGVSSGEMADYLGVSRNTISNWINGKTPVKKQTLRLWAMRTGVPMEWLETGSLNEESPGGDDPQGQGRPGAGAGPDKGTPSLYKSDVLDNVIPMFIAAPERQAA